MQKLVVFVDDCEGLRHLISLLFAEEGIPCHCYASYTEVIQNKSIALSSSVAVIDVNLGGGAEDGVAVYDWLRENNYQGRTFFLTGHSKGSPQVRRAEQTGLEVLEKPISPEELLSILKSAISEKERELRCESR